MPPEAEASALLIPNQAIRMTAKPRNMLLPIVSKKAACCVMSCVRNANRSFMDEGGMDYSLGHAPSQHRGTRTRGLGRHEGLSLCHKTDVVVEGSRFCVTLALGLDDLLLGHR